METYHETREAWLAHAMTLIEPKFKAHNYTVPETKAACGFAPGARGGKALGVCVSPKASAKGFTEIWISPTEADPVKVLGVLVHEMVHAAVGVEAGHGKAFKLCCDKLGLEGKATAALPGAQLRHWLVAEVLPMIGGYPHAAVDLNARKKQGTRMIKLVCPETGYTVRTTKKWLEFGLPLSPVGVEMQPVADEDEE
jgi:hypothetical protein